VPPRNHEILVEGFDEAHVDERALALARDDVQKRRPEDSNSMRVGHATISASPGSARPPRISKLRAVWAKLRPISASAMIDARVETDRMELARMTVCSSSHG